MVCPKCNTEVENIDQHMAEAHAEDAEKSAGEDQ